MRALVHLVVALMVLAGIGYAVAATRSVWQYNDKIAAQGRCGDVYRGDRSRFWACAIGVTLYGDGRQWTEMNWSRNDSYNSCRAVCGGCGEYADACREGCNIGRDFD